MAKWTVEGKPRMALFAGDKGIMTGEELTYDYNFNPFSAKSIQECKCGSDNCRGVLGPKPKETKEREIRDALNPIAGGGKRKIQQVAEDAIEGVKSAVKKRKLNVPIPSGTDVKNAMMRARVGITNNLLPQGKGKDNAKAEVKAKGKAKETAKVEEKAKPKKGAKPKLPPGWIYTEEMEEAPPPLEIKVFATDPEQLMRGGNRKRKQTSEAAGTPQKKRRTASGETLVEQNSGRSLEKVKDEDAEAAGNGGKSPSATANMKAKAKSVKKSIVRTMKGRQGHTPGTPGGKSIRVIEHDELEVEEEEEF